MGCSRQKGDKEGGGAGCYNRKWVKRAESAKAMRTGLQEFSVARTRIYPDAIINRAPDDSTLLLKGVM